MRVTVRVKPGSSRPGVGGEYGEALIVAVRKRAVDGKATSAVLDALASALGCRRRDVRLVSGAASRTKIVEIPDEHGVAFARLRAAGRHS